MGKVLLLSISLFLSGIVSAANVPDDLRSDLEDAIYSTKEYSHGTLHHKVHKDRLLKGGTMDIVTSALNENEFLVVANYTVVPKFWVPLPEEQRTGTQRFVFPLMLQSEEGYRTLADYGRMSMGKGEIKYLGRATIGKYVDCHKILLDPKKDNMTIVAYYHPSAPFAGWVKLEVTLSDLPVVGTHTAITTLVK